MRVRTLWPSIHTAHKVFDVTDEELRFPRSPRGQRHLFAVCRFDGALESADPSDAFVLTRGFWSEVEANQQVERLNAEVKDKGATYFVLPVRVPSTD